MSCVLDELSLLVKKIAFTSILPGSPGYEVLVTATGSRENMAIRSAPSLVRRFCLGSLRTPPPIDLVQSGTVRSGMNHDAGSIA